MSDDELRAAKFLRSIRYDCRGDGGYVDGRGQEVLLWDVDDARKTLADAWLAEHPADEHEPVTADWLRSVGGPDFEYRTTFGVVLTLLVVKTERDGWHAATIPVPLPTRGHVRRLCAALGIHLTESDRDRKTY